MGKAVGIALGTTSSDVAVMCDRESMAISGNSYGHIIYQRMIM